jgi:hypothetical protein
VGDDRIAVSGGARQVVAVQLDETIADPQDQ